MVALDHRIFLWISGLAGKFGPLDWAASHLANDYFIPAIIAMIAFGLWFTGRTPEERRRNQWGFIYAATGVGFSALAVLVMNDHYFRPRPYVTFPQVLPQVNRLFYQPTVSSFPSYPAALTFAFAFGIWLQNKKVGLVLFGLAALMSLARIYVGVHYPSDIVAGAAIGIVVTYLCSWIPKLILRPITNFLILILERLFLA
jgi:undecaprenyl-diphosphatase